LIGTYTVTAADVTTGTITNTGTGDSDETPPDGDTLITPVVGSPALDTAKALTSNADGDASGTVTQGDVLTYTVTVTNTGNIPLTNVVVTDSLITPTGGTTPCASVPVGGTCTLIGTYTVTAADVTTGTITNTGTGDSDETPPDGDTVITPVVGSPALNTAKALTSNADGDASGTVTQGDVLTYTVTVTNTGNIPLTNVVVTDSLITPTGGTTPCASIPVGGTCTLIGTYTVTAADVTTGTITNTGTGDSDETGPDNDVLVTPIVGSPALNTAKALTSNADGDASGTVTEGDVLTYTVTVTNAGNIPLTNVIVTDSLITPTGGTTPCASVPVGGTCTLIGTYTVTAADVTAGNVTNTGTGDSDETPPDADTVVTPVVGSPALSTSKALTSNADGDASGTVTQGDVLTYTVTVTNTGNIPLSNVVVADSLITATGGTTPCASVPVGGTCTLIGTYSVTAADVATGTITNTGTGDSDETPPDEDTLITPVGASPALTVVKSAIPGSFTVGQPGSYTITVTNTGSVSTFSDIVVSDNLPVGITLTSAAGGNWSCVGTSALTCTFSGTLTAGASTVLTLNVAVDSSAVDGDNSASASGGGDPNCPALPRCGDDVEVPVVQLPDLTVVKTHVGSFTQGQVGATYTLVVSNIGAGPTSGVVTLIDTLPMDLTAEAISGPGWTCVLATLTCTRSDILNPGASFPPVTLTVSVALNAASPLVNLATVTGGGDDTPFNNQDDDTVTIGAGTEVVEVDVDANWALLLLIGLLALFSNRALALRRN
ncbi:beta strand repeat-containing protein, partial [Dokdonella immobilis]